VAAELLDLALEADQPNADVGVIVVEGAFLEGGAGPVDGGGGLPQVPVDGDEPLPVRDRGGGVLLLEFGDGFGDEVAAGGVEVQ
jgi:hypothetical protein